MSLAVTGSRFKNRDREALERNGCSERRYLPSSLDGEVVGSLALRLTPSCGYMTDKRGHEGSWEDTPDAHGYFHFTVE